MGVVNMRYGIIVMAGLAVFAAGQPLQARAQQPPPSTAQQTAQQATLSPQEEAMQRFNRAVGLYEEHDYAAALAEFRRAYELAPTYKLLYQIGQVSYKLRDYAGALQAFEQYLREGGSEISPERRAQVEEELNLVKSQTGKIEINANVFGASVTIDDVAVGTTPLEDPVVVSAGKRKVTVSAQGRQTVTRMTSVAGQQLVKLNIELPAIGVKGETRTVYRDKAPSKMTTLSWVGVGAAAALGIGATVTGVAALSESKKMSDMSYVGSSPSDQVNDQRKKVKNLALGCDLLTGAALVTLAATLVLTYTRPAPSSESLSEKAPASKKAPETSWRPVIGFGSAGLVGEF